MAIVIKSETSIASFEAMGYKFAEGCTPAFDHDRQLKGIVDEAGDFKMTFPLNGHRGRNLAEEVLGERNADLWEVGKVMAVPMKVLRDLPGFDQKYYDVLEAAEVLGVKTTIIKVVEYDPGYGRHIILITGLPKGGLV